MLRIDMVDCRQHILRTRIHRLTALNDIVYSQFTENIIHAFPYRNCNKSHWFARFFLLFFLLGGHFFCIPYQFFLVFLSHIVNLHTWELTISKRLLDRKSGIICMDMNFYYVVVCHTDNRIPNRLQICFEFCLLLVCERFLCHNDKFCTIPKFDVCLCLRAWLYNLSPAAWFYRWIIDFFS